MPIFTAPASGFAGMSCAKPVLRPSPAKPAAAPAFKIARRLGNQTMDLSLPCFRSFPSPRIKRQTRSGVNEPYQGRGCHPSPQGEGRRALLLQYLIPQFRYRIGMAIEAFIGREPPGILGKLGIGLARHIGDRGP